LPAAEARCSVGGTGALGALRRIAIPDSSVRLPRGCCAWRSALGRLTHSRTVRRD